MLRRLRAQAPLLGMLASLATFALAQVSITWAAAAVAPLAMVAALSVAQAVVWPLSMLAQMQLRNVYLVHDDPGALRLFLALRLGVGALLLGAVALVAALLPASHGVVACALALALLKNVEHLADLAHAQVQQCGQLPRASRSGTLRCLLFMAVYAAALAGGRDVVKALMAALAATVAWVALVDLRGGSFAQALRQARPATWEQARPLLVQGLSLAASAALAFLALVAGRWAAIRANDLPAIAASALAATVASLASVVVGAFLQYAIGSVRRPPDPLAQGGAEPGLASLAGWLQAAFLLMLLGWGAAFVLFQYFGASLGARLGSGTLQIALALAGCYLVGGWIGVLAFRQKVMLIVAGRHSRVVAISAAQVVVATGASLALYPLMGWAAIGAAEILRGLTQLAAERYGSRGFDWPAAPSIHPTGAR